jgi:hypothetical protein
VARILGEQVEQAKADPNAIRWHNTRLKRDDGLQLAEELGKQKGTEGLPHGDPGLAAQAKELYQRRYQMMAEGVAEHWTMHELADGNNDPTLIANHEAMNTYTEQTAAAQDWVQGVVNAEGYGDRRKGTPGYQRMMDLTDEVNRMGTRDKPAAMARQVLRAEGISPLPVHDDAIMAQLEAMIEGIWDEQVKEGSGYAVIARKLRQLRDEFPYWFRQAA